MSLPTKSNAVAVIVTMKLLISYGLKEDCSPPVKVLVSIIVMLQRGLYKCVSNIRLIVGNAATTGRLPATGWTK